MIRHFRRPKARCCWIFVRMACAGYGEDLGSWYPKEMQDDDSIPLWLGEIPDGFQVDHKCRLRCCCNPDHLRAVTPQGKYWLREDEPPMHAKQTHCKNGHEFTPEKFTNAQGSNRVKTLQDLPSVGGKDTDGAEGKQSCDYT